MRFFAPPPVRDTREQLDLTTPFTQLLNNIIKFLPIPYLGPIQRFLNELNINIKPIYIKVRD